MAARVLVASGYTTRDTVTECQSGLAEMGLASALSCSPAFRFLISTRSEYAHKNSAVVT